jgi:hypothetical protein
VGELLAGVSACVLGLAVRIRVRAKNVYAKMSNRSKGRYGQQAFFALHSDELENQQVAKV